MALSETGPPAGPAHRARADPTAAPPARLAKSRLWCAAGRVSTVPPAARSHESAAPPGRAYLSRSHDMIKLTMIIRTTISAGPSRPGPGRRRWLWAVATIMMPDLAVTVTAMTAADSDSELGLRLEQSQWHHWQVVGLSGAGGPGPPSRGL